MAIEIKLTIPDEKVDTFNALMKQRNAKTPEEFINNCMSLMEWALINKTNGRIIASIDPQTSTYNELEFLLLNPIETPVPKVREKPQNSKKTTPKKNNKRRK